VTANHGRAAPSRRTHGQDNRPIVITGAAGLAGQNLVPRLKARGAGPLIAIDKHHANNRTFARLHPDVRLIEADLAKDNGWQDALAGARTLVLAHAQIAALTEGPFLENNVVATERLLEAARRQGVEQIVHISSSAVKSLALDFYTVSKKAQEKLVLDSGIPACVLRPTLMYGWFDRKHLGWLARFMVQTPVFPVPGHGRYLRQPLYVGDFCSIIVACIEEPRPGHVFNISGQEEIAYIDLIRALKAATDARAVIVKIPYGVFRRLLQLYALVDANPPFTVSQLAALVIPETFEVIDWPGLFGVRATPLAEGLRETFSHPVYSNVILEF
jgi:nucleoside-diphosphate-sugar epimerase